MLADRQALLEKRIVALRRRLLIGRLLGAAGTGALALALSLAPLAAGRSAAAPAPAKPAPLTVRAPFTVVDALGQPVVKVGNIGSERGLFLSEKGNETWGSGDAWKRGGGPTWVTGSYDPELNLIVWGTGNPSPDWNADVRPGDNLYSDSAVALDADTGALRWHF